MLLFWRQKWVLLLTMAATLAGAFTYLKVATPLYTSTATFSVTQIGTIALTNSQGSGQPSSSATFVSSQLQQIKGDEVLSRAAAFLKNKYTVKALRESIEAEMDRTTENLSITAKSPEPAEAQLLARTVYDAFKETRRNLTEDPASAEKQQQEQYLKLKAQIQSEYEVQEGKLKALADKYGPDIQQDERTSLEHRRYDGLLQDLRRADEEKEDATAGANVVRKMFADAATRPATSTDPLEEEMGIEGIGSKEQLSSLYQQIEQTKAQLQVLEQRFLPNHPTVLEWRKKYNLLTRRYLAALLQREQQAIRKYNHIKEQTDASEAALRKISAASVEYLHTKAEVERLRTAKNQFDSKIQEIQLSGIKVSDPFDGPRMPIKGEPALPDARKVFAVAIALGLVLGMILAAVREWLDDRMRSAGEIRTSLGMPLLAVIPQSSTKRSFSVSGQRVLLDPASDAAEAYRSLRTAIQFSAPEGLKTLMIGSPNSGDGKTTLTTNLGIAMAQSGKKVCIIDADLRKPTIHDIFSIKTTLGLSTLLAGRSTLDATIQRTNVTNLDVLPCGPVPANPAEVLNSQEFSDTLEDLADRYDIVLLDSPPVMSAADARVIAASCDATLIVLTAKQAHRRSTESTREALQGVGARVIGLVVNDVPRREGNGYGTPRAMRQLVPGLTNQEFDVLQSRK